MSLYPGNPYYYFYLLSVFLFILVFYIEELFKARKLNTCNDAINLEWSSTQNIPVCVVLNSIYAAQHRATNTYSETTPERDSNAAERYFRDQEPGNYQPRNDSVAQTQINASHFSAYGMTEHPSPHNKLLLVT